jgi:hypothetical protein
LDSIATFVTDRFNTTVTDSIRRDCFGDDLAAWLGEELRANGCPASATPIREDFGWAVKFDVNGRSYFASTGYVPGKVWFCFEPPMLEVRKETTSELSGSPTG